MIQSHIRKKILEKSIPLKEFGLRDLAWQKEDAKSVISSLMMDSIGILGGDVYKIDFSRLIPTYDNWHCEPLPEESKENYFLRSKKYSLNYIEQYPLDSNDQILFSIVFTEIID